MKNKDNLHQNRGGTKPQSKQKLYQVASCYSKEAILVLVELMRSRNENVKLGAAKAILNKTLPDLKVTEIQGDVEKPLGVVILPNLNEDKK